MPTNELKPCPSCGKERQYFEIGTHSDETNDRPSVVCLTKGCKLEGVEYGLNEPEAKDGDK